MFLFLSRSRGAGCIIYHPENASEATRRWDDHLRLLTGPLVDLEYVDETADIARHYSVDWGCRTSSPGLSETRPSEIDIDQRPLPKSSILGDPIESYTSENFLPPPRPDANLADYSPYSLQLSPGRHSSVSAPSSHFSGSQLSPGSRDAIGSIDTALPNLDEHEACLMRYFVVQLAPWRHFACTVPLRARTCPPLLNAIYTASARHLSRIKKYYYGNQIHYGGKVLLNLTSETAIHYHNQCIAHFVSLSDHSREAQDENLLAAAVILRFYEEVDCQYPASKMGAHTNYL
ncbi:hypothetical protein N7492_000769 [Penicillium capsulatum]|uniref:Uncharacterized protein n=1 Tax=Penicillium capsulatum TaxID=69766 RepID=A0A9W9IRW1_9EURO|nr:hypothetical protein N7492_000769 [Penicillium capsulatum]